MRKKRKTGIEVWKDAKITGKVKNKERNEGKEQEQEKREGKDKQKCERKRK